jgi:hypothetical protein
MKRLRVKNEEVSDLNFDVCDFCVRHAERVGTNASSPPASFPHLLAEASG